MDITSAAVGKVFPIARGVDEATPRSTRALDSALAACRIESDQRYGQACGVNTILKRGRRDNARRNEIMALRWSDLDPQKKELRIERALEATLKHGIRVKGPKKDKHKRTITINDDLLAILLAERDKHLRLVAGVPEGVAVDLSLIKLPEAALMFPNSLADLVTPRPPNTVTKAFALLTRRLGFKIRFHDCGAPTRRYCSTTVYRCMWWLSGAVTIRQYCCGPMAREPRRLTVRPRQSLATFQKQSSEAEIGSKLGPRHEMFSRDLPLST